MSVTKNTLSGAKNSTMHTMDGTLYDMGDTDFSSLQPGIMGVLSYKCGSTAGTYTKKIPAGQKIQVIDVVGQKVGAGGGAGASVQVKRGTTAITDAVAIDTDKALIRPATIDTAVNVLDGDSAHELNVVTVAGGKDPACEIHVVVKRVS